MPSLFSKETNLFLKKSANFAPSCFSPPPSLFLSWGRLHIDLAPEEEEERGEEEGIADEGREDDDEVAYSEERKEGEVEKLLHPPPSRAGSRGN